MTNRAIAGAIAVLGAALLMTGCGRAGAEEDGARAEQRLRTINVEVAEVQPRTFSHVVRIIGTVAAERDVVVSAEESGTVRQVLARQGERVRPGQPLIRLDAGVLRAQLEQAVSQAELAEETWARQRRLWEDEQVGTEMAYLQAKYNARTARAQARVLAERYERTTVRAPIGGILDERMVEVGSMVAAGSPVARILDVDTVKVVGGVPERYAGEVRAGDEVVVTLDRLAGREFAGVIDFVSAVVDRSNRTFTVEVGVSNAGLTLKPGMVANVEIARERVEDALVVPRHAVLRREDGYLVYVAVATPEGWRAEARGVVPGGSRGDEVVIAAGLEAGELVVVVGHQRATHGDALVITNERALPAPPAAAEVDGEAAAGAGAEATDG
jgi:membrane fusion protein, multidrug efflux system